MQNELHRKHFSDKTQMVLPDKIATVLSPFQFKTFFSGKPSTFVENFFSSSTLLMLWHKKSNI